MFILLTSRILFELKVDGDILLPNPSQIFFNSCDLFCAGYFSLAGHRKMLLLVVNSFIISTVYHKGSISLKTVPQQ
jgi:hypothetical protein